MFTFNSPAKITWEITTKCTRNCKFCYNSSSTEKELKLSVCELNKIADEIIECNPMVVEITGGEPLLYGDTLFSIIERFKNQGICVSLYTNADLIDEEVAKKLDMCNTIILPIVDMENSLIGEGSYQNVINAIQLLQNNEIEISLLFSNRIVNEVGNIVEMLKAFENIRSIGIMPVINTGCAHQDDLIVTKSEFNEFIISMTELITDYKDYFKIYYIDDSNELRNVIKNRQFYYSIYIKEDGEVIVNQWLKISAGNVLSSKLLDLWYSMKDMWYRKEISQYFRLFKNLNDESSDIVRCNYYKRLEDVVKQGGMQ